MKWIKRAAIFAVCVVLAIPLWFKLDCVEDVRANFYPDEPLWIDGLKVHPCLRADSGTREPSPFFKLRWVRHGPYDFYMPFCDFGKTFSRARLLEASLSTPDGAWTQELAIDEEDVAGRPIEPLSWTKEYNWTVFLAKAPEEVPTHNSSNINVPDVTTVVADLTFQLERNGATRTIGKKFELHREDKKRYTSYIGRWMMSK